MCRRVVCVGQAHRIVGAVVQQEPIAKTHDQPSFIERQLHVVNLVAPMGRADKMFLTVLNPLDRPA